MQSAPFIDQIKLILLQLNAGTTLRSIIKELQADILREVRWYGMNSTSPVSKIMSMYGQVAQGRLLDTLKRLEN